MFLHGPRSDLSSTLLRAEGRRLSWADAAGRLWPSAMKY